MFDNFAQLMTDAAGVAQGVRREAETVMKSQVERLLASMDVVTREEFEAVKEMAALARDENERLEKRINELEAKISAFTGAGSAGSGTA
jgi:BMFP domain-containing protein YqiC